MDVKYFEDHFNEIFKERGGIYLITEEDERMFRLKSLFRSLSIKLNEKAEILCPHRNMYFALINNLSFGAVARKVNNGVYIGIHKGSVLLLKEIFLRFMCNNSFLPFIGDAKSEIEIPKIYNLELVNYNDYLLLNYDNYIPKPKCPIRENVAYQMLEMALSHLLFHELAHIRLGHLDYIDNNMQLKEIDEMDFLDSKKWKEPIIIQSLEFDADSDAMVQSFQDMLAQIKNKSHNLDCIYESNVIALFVRMIPIYTLFKIQQTKFKDIDKEFVNIYNYPLPSVRLAFTAGNIDTIIEKFFPDFILGNISWKEVITYSIIAVNKAFSVESEQEFYLDVSSLSIESQSYIFHLRYYWNHIRPLLEPYADILAPYEPEVCMIRCSQIVMEDHIDSGFYGKRTFVYNSARKNVILELLNVFYRNFGMA